VMNSEEKLTWCDKKIAWSVELGKKRQYPGARIQKSEKNRNVIARSEMTKQSHWDCHTPCGRSQ